MRPTARHVRTAVLLSGSTACSSPKDRMPALTDSAGSAAAQPLPALEEVFECGELGFAEIWALVEHWRVSEVACDILPDGDRWPDLDWQQLARQVNGYCPSDAETSARWRRLREGCGLEATVNLSIHGYRTAGCPSGPYHATLGLSTMTVEVLRMVDEVCVSEEAD
jgi:hypothetical protein